MASNGTKHETLTTADAAWLHMERPTNPMVITGVFVFDERLRFDELVRLVEERLLQHERMRQRVVEPNLPMGRPRWELDPHFDVRAHVHRLGLPSPGDDAALREVIGDLMSTHLDLTRPLWQFYLLEGYNGGCAVVTRVHHCLGDGASLTRLLLGVADAPPVMPGDRQPAAADGGAEAASNGAAARGGALHAAEALLHESLDLVVHPSHLLGLAKRGVGGALSLGKLLLLPPDARTPLKGALGVVKRAACSEPIALARVKDVGRALGCTINDVLLAAMAGALRRYLLERGAAADRCIRAVVPVNLRGATAAVPEFGNHFGLVFVPMPVELGEPRQRLEQVKRNMDQIKATPESFVAFAILEAMGAASQTIEDLGVEIFSNKASMVMTNVPGPRERIALAGHPVRSMMFWVPQSGDIGLGVSILSYAGEVRLGVNTDVRLVPDPEPIVAGFNEEFAALEALAGVGTSEGARERGSEGATRREADEGRSDAAAQGRRDAATESDTATQRPERKAPDARTRGHGDSPPRKRAKPGPRKAAKRT